MHCRESEFRRYLRKAVKTFHTEVETHEIDNHIDRNVGIKIKHKTIEIHHECSKKAKWKKIIHDALHQFAHHPINRKHWYWKKRRCWETEEVHNAIEVPLLPSANEDNHLCSNCKEQEPAEEEHKKHKHQLKHLNWVNVKSMYEKDDDKAKYTIKMTNITAQN